MENSVLNRSNRIASRYGRDNEFFGTILIPDISGFTKFVNETEFVAGREITRELLNVIISSNMLDLKVSEIEGDAVLFFTRNTLSPIQIRDQYEIMLEEFKGKVKELSQLAGFEIDLTLKLIAHYGELSTYRIGRFEKLYGKTVIEAHSLLKNSIKSHSYFLITDNIFKANKDEFIGTCYYSGSQLCEVYGNLKKICYVYFDYEKDKEEADIRLLNRFQDHIHKDMFSKYKSSTSKITSRHSSLLPLVDNIKI